jgi:hypothetical protein
LPSDLPEPPSVLVGEHVNKALVKTESEELKRHKNPSQSTAHQSNEFLTRAKSWLMNCDSKERYTVDFRHFPTHFQTDEEAISTYNALGLEKKIHFKKFNIRRDENNFVYTFSL